MIKLIICLICIFLFFKLLFWANDHDKCYSDMERQGIASIGCCHGVVGGTRNTNYLSERCIDCPYFVDVRKEE